MHCVPPPAKYNARLVADDVPGAVDAANESSVSDSTTRMKSLRIVASIHKLAQIERAYSTATESAVGHIV